MHTFASEMDAVHRFFEARDYRAALERSRDLRSRSRENPEELGWAVYYEFRCLYALGRTGQAWLLLHSEDRRASRIGVTNEGWMCSVGSELAARLGRVDDVVRLGKECLKLRGELGDRESEMMCCQTVCTLLERLGRPDLGRDFAQHRAMLRDLAARNKRDPITVRGLALLSMLVQHGFEHVGYDSHVREDGCLFWITDAHAAAIGRCLSGSLRSFHLSLTTFSGAGFDVMTEAAPDDVALDKLVIHHRSGDEVTVVEARGLARLVTKLRVRNLCVWALEYESGALDALTDELERLNNQTLTVIDVCDLNKVEPDDRVPVPALEALIARNRAA
jgi:hypothetical protein